MRNFGAVSALLAVLSTAAADEKPPRVVEAPRAVIYRSPQKPSFTSWVGAWVMPNGDLMVSCTRATGPLTGRPPTPPEIRKRLDVPLGPGYDMNGLDLRNVYLRSSDGGKTWTETAAE